jgi:hypothetical protein
MSRAPCVVLLCVAGSARVLWPARRCCVAFGLSLHVLSWPSDGFVRACVHRPGAAETLLPFLSFYCLFLQLSIIWPPCTILLVARRF